MELHQSEIIARMREQIFDVDTVALELARTRQVIEARRKVEQMFRNDRNAARPEVAREIAMSAANIAYDAAVLLANDDPHDPKVRWWQARGHSWRGLTIPSGRWGADNPDNFYFLFPVDDSSDYEIVGQMPANPPAAMSFALYDNSAEASLATRALGVLRLSQIRTDADGRFVVTMGPKLAEPDGNHLQTQPGARWVMVRNSMTDWEHQSPIPIFVRRVGGPDKAPGKSLEQKAREAADLTILTARNWPLGHQHESYEGPPINTIGPLMNSAQRIGGGLATQMSTHSSFDLKPDEALVITAPTFNAPYYAIQLSNRWMTSIDYVNGNGSLNRSQSIPNNDGTVTWVISSRDPGVHNWAEPGGLDIGSVTIRFQDVPGGQPDVKPSIGAQVAKLEKLPSILPRETRFVTSEQRAEIRQQRAAAYSRRLHDILGPEARDLPR